MGEAKRRAARAAAQAAAGPAAVFVQMGIDTTAPGFYDHAAFQARERSDPVFLEQYARFVRDQVYSPQYLERSRRLIPRIAAILQEEMALAGRQRACMDGGLSLSKMLEQAGIWNTVVRGAFSAEVVGSPNTRRFFHAFGPLDQGSSVHGHVWLMAPPFVVVDVAAQLQPWNRPALAAGIPPVVLAEQLQAVEPSLELLVDPANLIGAGLAGAPLTVAALIEPHVRGFMAEFMGAQSSSAVSG